MSVAVKLPSTTFAEFTELSASFVVLTAPAEIIGTGNRIISHLGIGDSIVSQLSRPDRTRRDSRIGVCAGKTAARRAGWGQRDSRGKF